MDLPLLKYVDVVIGFALVMILASTVVLTVPSWAPHWPVRGASI